MSSSTPDPLVELRYTLAEADVSSPQHDLLGPVTKIAFAERSPGRPLEEPVPIGAEVSFARAVDATDALLSALPAHAWHQPALRDLDVQGLVGHLIGVEHDFQQALHGGNAVAAVANHVAATDGHAQAQRARLPASTCEEWRSMARRSVAELDEHAMSETISLHGLVLSLDALLIVRTFELWTHADDIRRAAGLALVDPDPSSLQGMVDLAMRLLPHALWRGSGGNSTAVRLVLVGAAGGTFDVQFSPDARCQSRARIVANTVDFCRLVANRIAPSDVALSVVGERDLAEQLFAAATSLALD